MMQGRGRQLSVNDVHLALGKPRHSPHYSNEEPQCLLTFIINGHAHKHREDTMNKCRLIELIRSVQGTAITAIRTYGNRPNIFTTYDW